VRRLLTLLVVLAVVAAAAGVAWAHWTARLSTGSAGAAAATSVGTGETPTATGEVDHAVTVSWGATTLASGDPVDGYLVTRYDAESPFAAQTTGTGCDGIIHALTCTESDVAPGSWQYTITPVVGANWTGAESDKSGIVTSAAVLTLDNTVFGLADFAGGAATVTGSLTGFRHGEGIAYRLDAATPLSGTPTSANSLGQATVSITLPRPSDGAHTVHALGDALTNASAASAAILVDTTPPAVTASLSPAANAAGWNNSSPVELTLTADDGDDSSGADTITYTTDGTDPTTSGTALIYSSPFDIASTAAVKYFATDHAGNASAVQTQDVEIDTTAPENALSLNVSSGGALLDGTTLWYRGAAAGSFTLANAVTDSGSGAASTGYASLSGTSTGWSFTSSSVTSGPPYVSGAFSWDAGTSSSPGETVTGYDAAGNFATTALAFADDSNAPSGGSVDATGLVGTSARYSTSTTLSIALDKGTDSGSGLAAGGAQLLRASAPLFSLDGQADGICGLYSAYLPLLADPTSPYTDNAAGGISAGNCYRYEYIVSDRVGNQTAYESGDIKVETAPPGSLTPGITLSSATGNTYVSGTTAYVNPQAGKSGSFHVSAAASDATSGMKKVSFPVPSGFTGGGDDTASPFETTYTWAGAAATASGAQTLTATDNATLTATSAFTVTPDTTNPTISASAKKADNTAYTAGTWTNQSVTVHYTCADSGSGIASCPADQTFSSDGTTASTSGTATDNVGNSAGASFGPIQIDKTNPTITASAKNADNSAYTSGTWT
jgi:hypothetical protein